MERAEELAKQAVNLIELGRDPQATIAAVIQRALQEVADAKGNAEEDKARAKFEKFMELLRADGVMPIQASELMGYDRKTLWYRMRKAVGLGYMTEAPDGRYRAVKGRAQEAFKLLSAPLHQGVPRVFFS